MKLATLPGHTRETGRAGLFQPRMPVTSLVAVGVAIVVTWIVLLLTVRLPGGPGGDGLVHDVVTRFMGLIVLAMGVQFALSGVRAFMGAG
jgi:multiple antibiotic resistance protein